MQEKINNFGRAGFLEWDVLFAYLTANLAADGKSSYNQDGWGMCCGVLCAAQLTCRITRKGKDNGMKMRRKPHNNKKNETILNYISAVQLISAGAAWF